MIIPWGTDAPIYHWPAATVAMIVVTTLAFFITGSADRMDYEGDDEVQIEAVDVAGAEKGGPEEAKAKVADPGADEDIPISKPHSAESDRIRSLALVHGKGLHPLQWLTSNFIHANMGHLIGNMIFLWAFGIIVEGKIGWYRFVPVYLGVGILQCALEQVTTLGVSESYSYGASAIIYGLLAMCLVWAPKNDLNCFVMFGFRVGSFEIPIMVFAVLYIGLEAVTVIFTGLTISSSLLHLTGAILGFALAAVMLKMNWVDCENWDLFAVMSGTHGQSKGKTKPTRKKSRKKAVAKSGAVRGEDDEASESASAEARSARMLELLRKAIGAGDAGAALATFQKANQPPAACEPPEAELQSLIKLLQQEKMWSESVPLMEQYVRRFPAKAARVRLKLAQVLVRDQQRPVQALRVLAEIPPGALPEQLEQLRQALEQKATQMVDDGVLELEGESW
jgi:membrane associated rhomboid family serine protease